ncbi:MULTISPECIES: MerR family transcriptional regulator [unclassified Thalassolituus]|jgi:DNA-binding transcriptional MerR regulator|uniref:MerR family transcriptional regulator n=1 Tax=unclassified Thalassolituus TaxID=2624967 RepID=UPI000C115FD0|nr:MULTISPECIES: MerR family transcriptional regulator [unclassified Thalassolituus]MBN58933.1 MerR family transcriptional regulator [Oceanospirillaceae bacterium]MDQ4426985.1 MerR family transcriptional regulator [Thalassolituus sp.]|tara:strand:- start:5515 stop:5883 length:369 start_codon:yes stop_codon:yes gene_type:complete
MLEASHNNELPPIPSKRYFTIGEVSELCDVKPHVLRYWEQEFPTLKPVKRAGNRRYYQRQDVILVREIRALLYQDGYTIGGARQKLEDNGESQAVAMDKALIKNMIRELKELEDMLNPDANL